MPGGFVDGIREPRRQASCLAPGCLLELGSSSNERSSVDNVYGIILQRIIRGEVVSGEVLVCSRMADELGVSRTPVVIAIDRLVSDGILIKENNRRERVKESAESWLVQIHQSREIIEPPTAGLAAKYITGETILRLEELAELSTPGSSDAWQQAARTFDFAIHLSIADHCRNIPLFETIHKCWKFKRVSYQLECMNPELEVIGHREHLAILSALSQHDSVTASFAMMFHLRSSLRYTKIREVV